MKKYILAAVIAVIAIALISILLFWKSEQENSGMTIVYSVWSGSIGWHTTMTIKGDGSTAILEEQPPLNASKTTKTLEIPSSEIRKLMNLIKSSNVFSLEAAYECKGECLAGMPSTSITFIIEGREKTVLMESGSDAPQKLVKIVSQLNTIQGDF